MPCAAARGPSRTRRPFTLIEKIAIVRESLAPGKTAVQVARAHGLALNLVYYWRRVYRDLASGDPAQAGDAAAADPELHDLRLQVGHLERLLGRRTLEIALLREQLARLRGDADAPG